jgi:hypothetical protein
MTSGSAAQHDAAYMRLGQHVAEHRIGRSGKAHIDDAGIFARGPIEALENIEGGALRAVGRAGKGAHREQLHFRRHANQLGMRGDGAGHAGAVHMRRRLPAERVVFVGDHAGEIGMAGIDLGIDHRHQHIVAIGDAMRFQQMQFGNDVLRGGAVGLCRRLRLSEPIEEIRLRPRYPREGRKTIQCRAHGVAAADAPALQGTAGKRETLRL